MNKGVFHLLYRGKGYDAAFIYSMTVPEFRGHIHMLNEQLKAEKDAHDAAAKKAKAGNARRGGRKSVPRRGGRRR